MLRKIRKGASRKHRKLPLTNHRKPERTKCGFTNGTAKLLRF